MKQHDSKTIHCFIFDMWCKKLKNSHQEIKHAFFEVAQYAVEYLQQQLLTYQTPLCNNARHLHSHIWSGTHLQDRIACGHFN